MKLLLISSFKLSEENGKIKVRKSENFVICG